MNNQEHERSTVDPVSITLGRAFSTPDSTYAHAAVSVSDGSFLDSVNDLAHRVENSVISETGIEETPQKASTRKVNRNRKTRSLYGVSPHCKFGPKGYLLESSSAFLDGEGKAVREMGTAFTILAQEK